MSLLRVEQLTAAYGHATALHGISFELEEGDAVGILGANGAGKTTTLRAISGMVSSGGRIVFDGREIRGLAPDRVARLGVAHVPEGRGTLPTLSVRENLLVGAHGRRDRRQVAEDLEYCLELFPNLRARLESNASAMSGGEQQMLAVSRGIMARPRLILLDEASLGLAPSTARRVYGAIERLRRQTGLTMLVVEQNAALAFSVVDRAIVLETGRDVLSGSREELMSMDAVRRAYLGG